MHPIKGALNRDQDLTAKFKGLVKQLVKDAQKALVLADCDCPFPAESQLANILTSIREATQVVTTVANDYQYRVPASPEKEAQKREAWEMAEKISTTGITEPNLLADRLLSKAYTIVKNHNKFAELVDILSEPLLERPDGSMCYCNPDVPYRMEDFGTSSEFGVCDGESKEVFNESIAVALSTVARAQMLLGIADYRKKGEAK